MPAACCPAPAADSAACMAAAARAMLGLPQRQEQPPVVWTDQYGVRIQRVGETRGATPAGDLTYHRDGRLAAAKRGAVIAITASR